MRFAFRTLHLILHLLFGLLLVALVKLDVTRKIRPEPLGQLWHRHLLVVLGVKLHRIGEPVRCGHLTVANHVSWLDISLIYACEPIRFVAKSEVRDWPIAGWLANAAGTFYLARGKGGSKPLLEKLTPFLRRGGSVVIFPEGTTTAGAEVLPFHPRLFAAAVDADCPVQPVALRYGLGDSGEILAPFIGDDDLVSHLLRLLKNRRIEVYIDYLPPLAAGCDRDALAAAAWQAVSAVVGDADLPGSHLVETAITAAQARAPRQRTPLRAA